MDASGGFPRPAPVLVPLTVRPGLEAAIEARLRLAGVVLSVRARMVWSSPVLVCPAARSRERTTGPKPRSPSCHNSVTNRELRGWPGRIVNISTTGAEASPPFLAAYASQQAGLEALTAGLRRE